MKQGLTYTFVLVFWAVGCQPAVGIEPIQPTQIQDLSLSPTLPLPATATAKAAASLQDFAFTPAPTPAPPLTPTPDTRLTARYWREWITVPDLSPLARQILSHALNNPDLDPHTFSKVGDCQMTSGTFLGGYASAKYPIPADFTDTVEWFSESMLTDGPTSDGGLGISSVLNPMFALSAGYDQCLKNETPLDCELRTRRPIIVLIGMGTNWMPNAEISFEKYLRTVVDRILETGALPILATKADNVEENWMLNQAIAQVAYDYDLPLVNVWRSVQDLTGRGIEKKVYLTPDGWGCRNHVWLAMLDKIHETLKDQRIQP
ncbi:MAG: SGNH/GDSL hydrolase family protein [Anaerolineaceae bacterium]|jgi:hypothetical protein|nr:MAG: SGNH/GDSL hydrolase family protein [Anaerolineaceae bacterium]